MKSLAVLVVVYSMIFINVAHSQETEDTVKLWTKYPGYIVTHSSDTVRGYLLLKNKISNQAKVFFFENPDDEKPSKEYKSRDIKAYTVASRHYESVKHSPEYTTMRQCFLLRTIDGPLKLFVSYYDDKKRVEINENDIWKSKIDFSFSEDELTERYYGSMNGDELEDFNAFAYLLKFHKTMSAYLKDCPETANKIASKEKGYLYTDLKKIIAEYNQCMKQK
jgi:hypothetical protein